MKRQIKPKINYSLNVELRGKLKELYHSLPVSSYLKLRDELCSELFWSKPTFYSRMNGRRLVRDIEIPIVKRVFEKYGIEIFK